MVRQPTVGVFDGPAHPEWNRKFERGGARRPLLRTDQIFDPVLGNTVADAAVVLAAIEMQRLDINDQAALLSCGEGRFEQDHVVAVRAVDCPPEWHTGPVGE